MSHASYVDFELSGQHLRITDVTRMGVHLCLPCVEPYPHGGPSLSDYDNTTYNGVFVV